MKILLVDDDAGSLRGMKIALNMLKHVCDAYSDPCEAVKNYSNHTYDLIITDIYMPTLDGFTLAGMIRHVNPQAKIIFISGHSIELLNRKIDVFAKRFFLRKPIEFHMLKQALDNISIGSEAI